jgi:hypothetical protein
MSALETRGESYGELADRMARDAELCPHAPFDDGACPECGSDDPGTACTSHPDWIAELRIPLEP